MTSIAEGSVIIQTSLESAPSPPSWFGEAVLLIEHLRRQGILTKLCERVPFARRRFGRYEVIDYLAILFGYALSGERPLQEFYQRLEPFAGAFMALFERDHLPSRSALSRFFAALTEAPVEALRTLFLDDLLSRPLSTASNEQQTGGLVDRKGQAWVVFDIDGTREAARQRALPKTKDLPLPVRRLDEICAPGYKGRKRGQVVRTGTIISQAHSYQWLGSLGNRGNGRYREELRRGFSAIGRSLTAYHLPAERALLRLDGQYGVGTVLADLASFAFVTRGKEYRVLDHPLVQARLPLPPDQFQQRPESQRVRSLYDCPPIPVGAQGARYRVVVATHPATTKNSPVGVTRAGIVYELFFTHLPQHAFTARDVVELYLHRGAFEPTLSDEDQEIDPDRWCSHSAWGQEAWQVISQWVWNLRLERGHHLKPQPVRISEVAPALSEANAGHSPEQGDGAPVAGGGWKAGSFSDKDFPPQPDGTLRCPTDKRLLASERRREADGSLRVVYEARIADCRACPQRPQCQWHGHAARHPRRVSILLHPLNVGSAPFVWRDWPRCEHRRACMQLLRNQRVDVSLPAVLPPEHAGPPPVLPRAERAHYRLDWQHRLVRNARRPEAVPPTITLHGVPEHFAAFLGLPSA